MHGCSFGLPSQKFQQHPGSQHRAQRVCYALTRDIRCRAMHRLKQRRPPGMNIPRRRQPQPPGQLRPQVANDVAEQVAGNDHIELPRIPHNLHRQRIDIKVPRIDLPILLPNFLEDPLPQIVRESHRVGLVAHADALQSILPRMFKRVANEHARKNGLKRVCMSDKSNAMTFAHDLWQRVFKEVRQEYGEIDSRHLYIDTLAMEIVRDPRQFDVIVTCNLFGDIISDLGAQLAGGLGLAPSGNIHPGRTSLFEPVHGSAPNIAGKGIANPLGSVLTAGMLLEFLGWKAEAAAVHSAVKEALLKNYLTPELGGTKKTVEVGDWIAERVSQIGTT